MQKVFITKTENPTPKYFIRMHHMHTYPSFNKILCPYVDYGTSNGLGRVEAQSVVFIPFPWVEYSLCVNSSFINCTRNSYIYQLTALKNMALIYYTQVTLKQQLKQLKGTKNEYHRRTPSFTISKRSLEEGSIGRYFFKNSSSAR